MGLFERDYQRLRELHLAYFRELRSIVAASESAERVVLAHLQLLPLAGGPIDTTDRGAARRPAGSPAEDKGTGRKTKARRRARV